MKIETVLQYCGYVTIFSCLFGLGFYLGYKNKEAKVQTPGISIDINSSSNPPHNQPVAEPQNGLTQQNSVYWIKVGTEPICPPEFPIKGKFDTSTAKFYYTKENKFYDRVRPDICFGSEEFALNVAGFLKKY